MIGLPPSEAGADHRRFAEALPAVATTSVGGPGGGAGCGVITGEAVESGPGPAALIAATVHAYPTPLIRPPTMKVVAAEPVRTGVCAFEPTYGVIWYPVIGLPPFEAGAVQESETARSSVFTVTFVGAPGTFTRGGGIVYTVTSSKSLFDRPSFQSWMRWRFAVRA